MPEQDAYAFTSQIEKFDSNLWGFHFTVPAAIVQALLAAGSQRVVCTLNETVTFQCALMPKGAGEHFINVNKKIRDRLRLREGSPVQVALKPDESKYGLPMPEELAAVLESDPEANALFHALTPGKQRTLLYWAGQPGKSDGRIDRALRIAAHLTEYRGKLNYRILYYGADKA